MLSKRRLLLCRLSFIVLCGVPTLVVCMGIILPNRRQPWEERVFQELGLRAKIGRVDCPRPNTAVLGQVVVSDPEFGTVSRLHAVEVQDTSKVLRLRLIHPEIRADRLDLLCRAIQEQLMRRGPINRPIEVTCAHLTLSRTTTEPSGSHSVATFSHLAGRIATTDKGSQLTLRFLPPGAEESQPCQILIERAVSTKSGPSINWKLDTGNHFVSCDTFSTLFLPLARLGSDCSFRGSIKGSSSGNVWNGTITGEFVNVDLYRLVQEQFPHTFDGMANVRFSVLDVRHNRIVRAVGNLRSERGVVGNSLIEAAAEQLGCRLKNKLPGTATRYRVLDVGFEVTAQGLVVVGKCDSFPGAMIEGQYGEPLLIQPDSSRPLATLARVLVPQSNVQVPLTHETSKLLSLFPIPSLERHQKPGVPRTTLRLE